MTNPLVNQETAQIVIERPAIDVKGYAIRQIGQVEQLKQDLKLKREMLRDTLENDADYSEAQAKVKEAQRDLKVAKAMARARNKQILELEIDIKELNAEKKETQLGLFATLDVYQTNTHNNVIDMPDGTELELKKHYKLKRR